MKTTISEEGFKTQVTQELVPDLLKLLTAKGKQYSDGTNAFVNFEEGSKLTVDTREHYLMSLATKQWHVISDWSKRGGKNEARAREVEQRIYDVLVYMLLLLAMLKQTDKEESQC